MADQQQQNDGNGNGSHVFDDMTLGEAMTIVLEEIRNVGREIRGDLGGRIDKVGDRLGKVEGSMDKLEKEFGSLRMEVHQNQTTFIKNHEEMEKRVEVLEVSAT